MKVWTQDERIAAVTTAAEALADYHNTDPDEMARVISDAAAQFGGTESRRRFWGNTADALREGPAQ